jgi:nitrite reductase/ring-hydroxylating ferredoxin subunit
LIYLCFSCIVYTTARETEARDPKELRAMAEYVAVSGAGDLGEGEMRAFDVRGTQIAVANVGGVFHAFDDTCTHVACSLAEGDLEETTVICPCHGSEFDVRRLARVRAPHHPALPDDPVALERCEVCPDTVVRKIEFAG